LFSVEYFAVNYYVRSAQRSGSAIVVYSWNRGIIEKTIPRIIEKHKSICNITQKLSYTDVGLLIVKNNLGLTLLHVIDDVNNDTRILIENHYKEMLFEDKLDVELSGYESYITRRIEICKNKKDLDRYKFILFEIQRPKEKK
jgi:hypothetical protein